MQEYCIFCILKICVHIFYLDYWGLCTHSHLSAIKICSELQVERLNPELSVLGYHKSSPANKKTEIVRKFIFPQNSNEIQIKLEQELQINLDLSQYCSTEFLCCLVYVSIGRSNYMPFWYKIESFNQITRSVSVS